MSSGAKTALVGNLSAACTAASVATPPRGARQATTNHPATRELRVTMMSSRVISESVLSVSARPASGAATIDLLAEGVEAPEEGQAEQRRKKEGGHQLLGGQALPV